MVANTSGEKAVGGSVLLALLKIAPRRFISRVAGGFAGLRFPRPLQVRLLRWFANRYAVDLSEAERPLEEYPSLNEFFTRALKPGARPVDERPGLFVSPVDAVVSQRGLAENGRLIQAKGIDYSVDELLAPSGMSGRFRDGAYAVLYLSPPDYHRIHTPCAGRVTSLQFSPGTLYPVNQAAVLGIEGLFRRNERLTSFIETEAHGLVAVVKVGATNVGKIRVVYSDFHTNRAFLRAPRAVEITPPYVVERGAELARFEMGSTVILLFEAGRAEFLPNIQPGTRVRVGEAMGRFVG